MIESPLERFACREGRAFACRNCEVFARARISAFASGAVFDFERPEIRQRHLSAANEFVTDNVKRRVNDGLNVDFCRVAFVSDGVNQFAFEHLNHSFERVKEEARLSERPLAASVNAGFKNAMSSILDSNITTLIAGFVLFFMGSGSAQGFAVTLVVGVILSMFTAVVFTRQLLKLFLGANLIQSPAFYGI